MVDPFVEAAANVFRYPASPLRPARSVRLRGLPILQTLAERRILFPLCLLPVPGTLGTERPLRLQRRDIEPQAMPSPRTGLHRRSLAIMDDYGYDMHYRFAGKRLDLAQLYLALRKLTGESGRWFDDYKGSFSFPFGLDVLRKSAEYPYLLEVRNNRTMQEFMVRKVVAPDDPRLAEHIIHDAFAGEFSRHEIIQTIACLYRFLLAFWETMKDDPHEPFLRAVTSNLVLFGFCDGDTFEKQYVSDTRFHALREKYGQRVNEQKAANGQAPTRRRHGRGSSR